MATIRKRSWLSPTGPKVAWVADYSDQDGTRRLKTFPNKKAADAWLVSARSEVAAGTHTADSASVTVAVAADLWIRQCELRQLERGTVCKYKNHVDLHIVPMIGTAKLSRLTAPMVETFRDDLLSRLSWAMTRKVMGSLKALLGEAQRRGLVGQNVAAVVKVDARKRHQRRLEIGVDIPTKAEIAAILEAAQGRYRPLLVTAVFTGLRSSELRGLAWDAVDFEARVIHVRQRADEWRTIGSPKSKAGHRTVPMSPLVFNTLREWKLGCPRADGRLWLVFPNGAGQVESHSNIINRGFNPIQVEAGIGAKYGLHALRHFFASWAIEQGFVAKKLQTLMGHSSIQMTFDTYGHLFPDVEGDHAKFAAGELSLSLRSAT